MPVLHRGGHRGRAAAKPTPPIVEPGEAIATRTRRRQQQPQLKKSNWQQQNRHQIPVAINENAPPEGVALLTAAPVAPEEDKIFEEEAGREVVREKKMDDCCNGARSIDKANAGDEDGSTPPIPEKVYFQLENLCRADPPYKSVAALNCVILGCANTWDLNRAYQTFEAMSGSFELTPNIHSYNALMFAFGRLKQTFEASRVFEHLTSLGVKPNAKSYSLLVDAHLINRNQKAALSVIDEMVTAGFTPTRETLKKVRRRCVREIDVSSNERNR